ncbi:MAG: hypothetical protein A2Z99_09440 [Treponema sp. GWB1_62_6]|nr:MAG: hypothetical protein A2Z99_09440 [Treponema sp. GWB1_62_6]
MILEKTTIGSAPHAYLTRTTAHRMWLVSACLVPPVLQSAAGDGWRSLSVALAAVVAALLSEAVLDVGTERRSVADGSAAATALVLALLLPNLINPAAAALGAIFAIVVVKRSFGGLGSNWLNPAVAGWLFIRASWPAAFSAALSRSPLNELGVAVSKGLSDPNGSPLAILKVAGFKASGIDTLVSRSLNDGILSWMGAELPGGYVDLFMSADPGIIADRGALALLLATIILLAHRSMRSAVPGVFLFVLAALVRFGGALPYGGPFGGGDVLFSFLTGGTILGAFLLIADPATGPKSERSVVAIAAVTAAIAYGLRYRGAEQYAAPLAAGVVNAFVPYVRMVESRYLYSRWRHS